MGYIESFTGTIDCEYDAWSIHDSDDDLRHQTWTIQLFAPHTHQQVRDMIQRSHSSYRIGNLVITEEDDPEIGHGDRNESRPAKKVPGKKAGPKPPAKSARKYGTKACAPKPVPGGILDRAKGKASPRK